MAEDPVLHIRLLGAFHLACAEGPVTSFVQTRLQYLLAYLILHRDATISRQQLAFTFWPDTDDEQARTNFRTLLHRLRKTLPQSERLIQVDRQMICWRPGAEIVADTADFTAAIERAGSAKHSGDRPAERQALQQAVETYAGDLLPDCYDDWIAPFRERLSQAALQATARLALLLEDAGDYPAALTCALRLMQADPLNEATYHQLMRLHGLNGDRTGVARAFNTCQATLRHELGAAPDAETCAVYQAALAQATAITAGGGAARPADRGQPGALPVTPSELTSLVGRERELAHVRQLLTAHRLVTLTGAGGVGKSRLALRAASDLRARFADGAWRVDLGPVRDPTLVTATVAAALGAPEGTMHSVTEALARWLSDRRLLLVLDNCEHLTDRVGRLAQTLLRAAPHVRMIATSQQSLGVEGEIAWRVPPLAVPSLSQPPAGAPDRGQANALAAIGQNESVQLFVDRARTVLPTFALAASNADAVAQLCRRLDGIPLAIELAATRIRTLSTHQIAARLDDAFALLSVGGSRASAQPAHQKTLWAAMEWSHGLLSKPEQILFRRLAVFAGSFTLEDAEVVCAGHGLAVEQILGAFAGLEDKSLVESEPAAGQRRFRLHEVVLQYARMKLTEAGERERIEARHLDVYAHLAAKAAEHLNGEHQAAWLDRLEAEHDNLRAALACSGHAAGGETGLRMAGGLARFWATRGYFREGRHWANTLLAASAASPATQGRLEALRTAASLAYYQTDYAEARGFYEQALTAAQALDDRPAIAAILRGLGTVAHGQADCERAQACYRESLALCREIGDRQGEATALANLGLAAWQHGDGATGRGHLETCLALRQQLGDEVGIAYALHLLADIAWSEGRAVEAQSLNDQSLTMRRRLGDKWGLAYSLDSLAVIAWRQGDGVRARSQFAESLLLFNELGSQHGLSDALDHLAGLLTDEGSPGPAAQLMAAATALREAIHAALPPNMQREHDQQLADIRNRLGDERFRAAWLLGRALMTARAVQLALELTAL